MNAEESDKTPIKTEKRNRNEENRRQIIDFIADNGISDAKTDSKTLGLKPSRTRDYLKQLLDEGILEVEGEYKNRKLGLRSKHHSPIPNITINYVKHCLFRTIRLFKHLLQVGFVFSRCALAAIHGVNQIKVHFSVQMAFDFQIVKLLLQAPVIAA